MKLPGRMLIPCRNQMAPMTTMSTPRTLNTIFIGSLRAQAYAQPPQIGRAFPRKRVHRTTLEDCAGGLVRPPAVVTNQTGDVGNGEVMFATDADAGGVSSSRHRIVPAHQTTASRAPWRCAGPARRE